MKPELIIFDWDGTLADTTNPIIAALRQSFADYGLPAPEAEKIRPLIGYSLAGIVHHLAPELDRRAQEGIIETYAAHHLNPNNRDMRLFDSALPCLEALKAQGFLLAVATGKGRTGLDNAVAQTGTAKFWDATACAGEYPSKPAPDMIFGLCDRLGLRPSETLIVGDTTYDLEMAANAKAPAAAVATGAHTAAQLRTAPHLAILASLAELPAFAAAL